LESTRRVQPDGWGDDCRNLYRPGNFAVWKDDFSARYVQVFEERTGFIPGLSILDLLFCVGKEAAGKMLS
jgi:WbqC-like protein family